MTSGRAQRAGHVHNLPLAPAHPAGPDRATLRKHLKVPLVVLGTVIRDQTVFSGPFFEVAGPER
jgi:hypothetical protein